MGYKQRFENQFSYALHNGHCKLTVARSAALYIDLACLQRFYNIASHIFVRKAIEKYFEYAHNLDV